MNINIIIKIIWLAWFKLLNLWDVKTNLNDKLSFFYKIIYNKYILNFNINNY